MLAAIQAVAGRLDADQLHRLLQEVIIEDAHGVGAAADASDDDIRLAPRQLRHLHAALLADDRLEVAHHHRIGMRPATVPMM